MNYHKVTVYLIESWRIVFYLCTEHVTFLNLFRTHLVLAQRIRNDTSTVVR